jgi:hypothetical protein
MICVTLIAWLMKINTPEWRIFQRWLPGWYSKETEVICLIQVIRISKTFKDQNFLS